jgi:hypothetical protein
MFSCFHLTVALHNVRREVKFMIILKMYIFFLTWNDKEQNQTKSKTQNIMTSHEKDHGRKKAYFLVSFVCVFCAFWTRGLTFSFFRGTQILQSALVSSALLGPRHSWLGQSIQGRSFVALIWMAFLLVPGQCLILVPHVKDFIGCFVSFFSFHLI